MPGKPLERKTLPLYCVREEVIKSDTLRTGLEKQRDRLLPAWKGSMQDPGLNQSS